MTVLSNEQYKTQRHSFTFEEPERVFSCRFYLRIDDNQFSYNNCNYDSSVVVGIILLQKEINLVLYELKKENLPKSSRIALRQQDICFFLTSEHCAQTARLSTSTQLNNLSCSILTFHILPGFTENLIRKMQINM